MPSFPRFMTAAPALLALACITPPLQAATLSFPGAGTGPIPITADGDLPITFNVAGLTQSTVTVELRLQIDHTFVGDLEAVLTSPGGRARMVVFSRAGRVTGTSNGYPANLSGLYEFSDSADGDLWAAAEGLATGAVVPAGSYRAVSMGTTLSTSGGCPTSLTGVFGGLTPAQANGSWTLTVGDRAGGDSGSVTAATLVVHDAPPSLFANGFEAPGLLRVKRKGMPLDSRCSNKIQADFNGDGLTDFVLARGAGTDLQWIVRYNLGNGTATPEVDAITFTLGNPATDFIDTVDYDGDRLADATVWNEAASTFRVRRSSRGIDPVVDIVFGQEGDDPTQSGDYDGDARDDLAVFRAPPISAPDGPMQVVVRATDDGSLSTIFTGLGVDGDAFPTSGFDYSGDGLADVSVQEADAVTPADARFTLFDGRTGAVIANFIHGKSSDFIIPGNYLGNRRFDTTVRRTVTGTRRHFARDSANPQPPVEVIHGITGDSSVGGDYDGDGLSDYAVWRGSMTPGMSKFIVRSSRDTAIIWEIPAGQAPTVATSDFAVAGSRVH
jgi:hypothetical protein